MSYLEQFKIKFQPTQLQIFFYFLLVYSLSAAFLSWNIEVIGYLAYLIIFNYLCFIVFRKITQKSKFYINSLITTLIIFLVYHYTSSFAGIIAASAGIFSVHLYKNFFYYKSQPIINPAVFAILFIELTSYLINLLIKIPVNSLGFTSWWGTEFGNYISLVLILIWTIYGTIKWRKIYLLSAFLICSFCLNLVYSWENLTNLIYIFTSSTLYFYAAVMLIEPKTSPVKKFNQSIYGLVAAISLFLLRENAIANPEIISIALANISNITMRELKL